MRRRRLGKGTPHADVERLLEEADKLSTLASLALFDDAARGGDVMTRLNKDGGTRTGDLFKDLNSATHKGYDGDLEPFVRSSEKLAKWFRGLA